MEPPLHLFPLMCNHCHPPAESSSKAFGLRMLIISCRKKKGETSNRPAGTLQQNVRHGVQRFKKRHLEWFGLAIVP